MLSLLNRKSTRRLAAGAAALMFAISGVSYFNKAGTAPYIYAASTEYKTWRQSDSRWGSIRLGNSWYTLSDSGCAVTSMAKLLVHSGLKDEENFDPGVFCNFLNNNGGFSGDGDIYWGTVSKLVPQFTFEGTAYLRGTSAEEKTAEIKKYLDMGYYIISDVKYSSHWVAIDRVEDGIVYDMDSASYSGDKLFTQYDYRGATTLKLFRAGSNSYVEAPGEPVEDQSSEEENTNVSYETGKYKTTSALNLRKEASISAGIADVIGEGEKVDVTEVSGRWGKVSYFDKTGWICLEYAELLDEEEEVEETENTEISEDTSDEKETGFIAGTYVTNDVINYRELPDVSSDTYGLIQSGTELTIHEISGNWGRTLYNDKISWVCLDYVDRIGDATDDEDDRSLFMHYMTLDYLNLRTNSGMNNSVICVIPNTTLIPIMEVSDNWGKTEYNGSVGWVCLDYAVNLDEIVKSNDFSGDVNKDGEINIMDFIDLLSVCTGEKKSDNLNADINEDGTISAVDIALLKVILFNILD